jgi:hypothetical protein
MLLLVWTVISSASTVGWVLFTFGIQEFICQGPVHGESKCATSRNTGRTTLKFLKWYWLKCRVLWVLLRIKLCKEYLEGILVLAPGVKKQNASCHEGGISSHFDVALVQYCPPMQVWTVFHR